ncbi:hypothetical protein [Gilvimarinus algae]|uniref:SnoaL-like domain-containing protein n=1 Tax=Gilvimarinus algae TaxID=3058037 RepID=A0ABT8TBR4_9GAMM|nr:hypothetical protein [Gilvimarinus sp. SDUM040014]MDO3381468.1 hypothetical protein [Gilvimarinus sp. SDUM040014]
MKHWILFLILLCTACAQTPSPVASAPESDRDPAAIVSSYLALWQEPDPQQRLQQMAALWHKSGEHRTPRTHSVGLAEFNQEIGDFQAQFPGAQVRVGKLRQTGPYLSFDFALLDTSGQLIVEGLDYLELAPNGKIRRVIGFF